MDFHEVIAVALDAIRINKMRSILTSLGIIIGVAAIILLISIGQGLQEFVTRQFESLGTNSLFIIPGKASFSTGGGPNQAVNKLTFTLIDSLDRQKGPYISEFLPFIEISVTAGAGNKTKVTRLVGTRAGYFKTTGIEPQSGRLFSVQDDTRGKKVAVIGMTVAKELFGSSNPLNKSISLSNKSFTVIGVLKPQGNAAGIDVDNRVIIPLNAAHVMTGTQVVNAIIARTNSTDVVPLAKNYLERVLLRSLSSDDFTISSQEQLLSSVLQIIGVLTAALGGIAAISLVVGGVGISNIMLVSVTERTKEIGLRKAIGALPNDILGQFLIEAVILSLFGGIIGVTIGYVGSLILSIYLRTSVPLWSVLLGLGFSSVVGVVFGVAPAFRAARLQPIETLRHE